MGEVDIYPERQKMRGGKIDLFVCPSLAISLNVSLCKGQQKLFSLEAPKELYRATDELNMKTIIFNTNFFANCVPFVHCALATKLHLY